MKIIKIIHYKIWYDEKISFDSLIKGKESFILEGKELESLANEFIENDEFEITKSYRPANILLSDGSILNVKFSSIGCMFIDLNSSKKYNIFNDALCTKFQELK